MTTSMVVRSRSAPLYPRADAYAEVFFRCEEQVNVNGSGVMVDNIRGATYQPSLEVGATLVNGTGTPVNSLSPTIVNPVVLSSGSWPNFRQRSIVTFAFGRLIDRTKARVPIGNGQGDLGYPTSTGGNISMSLAGSPHILITSATQTIAYVTGALGQQWDLPPNGTDVGIVLEFEQLGKPNPRLLSKMIDAKGNLFSFNTPPNIELSITYIPTILEFNGGVGISVAADVNPGLNNKTRMGGLALYSFAAFSFPGTLPSRATLDSAYIEMMHEWSTGRKYPPSQFNYLNRVL